MASSSLRDLIARRVLLLDGAIGTELLARAEDLAADAPGSPFCLDVLTSTRPELVRAIHDQYLAAGCDLVTTNSFGAAPHALADHGHAARGAELGRAAAALVRAACDAAATEDRPRFAVGAMGPGRRLPSLGQVAYSELRASYLVLARALLAGGVDALLVETVQDPLQAKAAVNAALEASREARRDVPLFVALTLEVTGTLLSGAELDAALAVLDPFPIDLVGLNCALGPREMEEHVRALAATCRRPIGVWPNAGLPQIVAGRPHYPLTPAELADWLERFVAEDGAALVGGCCGTTPEHMAAVAVALGERPVQSRKPAHRPRIAGALSAVDLAPAGRALLIGAGEECDVRDLDAAALDGRALDAAAAPLRLIGDASTLRAACEHLGGRPLLFAATLEGGAESVAELCAVAREHGAVLLARCLDERGPARTAEEKLRVARRLHQLCVEEGGLRPSDVLIDVLSSPIATGEELERRAALETLDGLRRVRAELPGVGLLLHLGDVSVGLPEGVRPALDAVLLSLAREAGLTAASPGPHGLAELDSIDEALLRLCEDALLDRRREGYDALAELSREGAAVRRRFGVRTESGGLAPRRSAEGRESGGFRPDSVPTPQVRSAAPGPPFLGSRITERVELSSVLPYVDEATLFQRHWGHLRRGRSALEHRRFLAEEVRPLYHALARRCAARELFELSAAHGYWRALRAGDGLVLLDSEDPAREVARLSFPRSEGPEGGCVADWFAPGDAEPDTVALLCVTLGPRAAQEIRGGYSAGRHRDSLELAGLAAELLQGFLEAMHRQVRGELGISRADARDMASVRRGGYRGCRLLLGQPPCGGTENLAAALSLLRAKTIGVGLDDSGALVPEDSAVAMVCHHPDAHWFPV
jgi:methionine synthase I (cobalamin-dependent)